MAQKTKNNDKPLLLPAVADAVRKHHKHAILLALACALALGLVVAAIGWYYRDRALPNVSLGSIDVSGKTKEEIKQIALAQKDAITLTFENGEQKVQASPEDVGLYIDVDASVDQATWARRTWLDLLLAWEHKSVPLVYTNDLGKAKAFAKEKFPDLVTDAKDAQIVFNDQTNSYDLTPGEKGQGFDAAGFVGVVEDLAKNPQPISLQLSTTTVWPVIKEAKLQTVQEYANKTKDLQFKFKYQGALKYTANPKDISLWTHFAPDTTKGILIPNYDQAAIEEFLRNIVGPRIATKAQDRKIVRDSNTGKEITIQSGREGREIANLEALAKEILAAVEAGQSLEKDVEVTTSPFKTVTLTGTDRWIEVDLSEQRTSLYLGAERVASFTVSTGVSKWPTVQGEFAIRHKNAKQVMSGGSRATGDYYYLPNVTWVSYFYQDYGFHTAYWHNNFGTPMSHGCVNMREADAKALYDFAPIGTRVIVHG